MRATLGRFAATTIWVFSCWGTQAPPAWAQEALGDRERAFVMYEQSAALYEQEEYEEAAVLLQQAYDLAAEPVLLFNLARALERSEKLEDARARYARFLETAEAEDPQRPRASEAIERIDQAMAAREAERARRIREEQVALLRQRQEAERRERHRIQRAQERARVEANRRLIGPSILTGVGVLATAAPIIIGVSANARHRQARDMPASQENANELQTQAQNLARGATIAWVATGVVIGVGIVWLAVALARRGRPAPMSFDGTSLRVQF